ncbi:MAG: nucleotidyltransferase family protein [Candidatus Zambryskibacteria bacterium]|nr:nucleotidyltransferase family protein [Candidatus Zambryskibacteria bacterium]
MKVIILAAGEGTRLHPLTLTTPKPLIDIAGKTIVERIFSSLPDEIKEVIMVVGHLKEKIQTYLGDNFQDRKVIYAEQRERKGTFGALESAKDLIGVGERFMVLNGDDLHSKDELEKFLKTSERAFGVQKMVMPNYYSVVVEGENISGFRSQTETEKKEGTLVATGVYILDSEIFKHPGVVVFGGELGLPQTILAQKNDFPLTAITTSNWLTINYLSDIEKVEALLSNKEVSQN